MEKVRPAGLSRNKFCQYMHLNRSTLYYKPKGESEENLEIMAKIDHIYTEHPYYNVQRPHQSLDGMLPAMKYGIAV